jgi:hypothetical protein
MIPRPYATFWSPRVTASPLATPAFHLPGFT